MDSSAEMMVSQLPQEEENEEALLDARNSKIRASTSDGMLVIAVAVVVAAAMGSVSASIFLNLLGSSTTGLVGAGTTALPSLVLLLLPLRGLTSSRFSVMVVSICSCPMVVVLISNLFSAT